MRYYAGMLALLLTILFVKTEKVFGSHGMGGEISWTCQGNGTYKFRLIFYRDCNGITPTNLLNLQTNHPIGVIPVSLVQQTDISPLGFTANGDTLCPTCNQGSFSNPIPGLVEQYIYESADITLSGVPPATGWWFRWGECCRSSALTNIIGGGSSGFGFRAYMYPYNGQNASPCYDSSPHFVESPATIACAGAPFQIDPQTIDPDLDVLRFSWGSPVDDSGNSLTFAPGYSVSNQLPGVAQNSANTPATLDSLTGIIHATSFTTGYFCTVVKAESYKCGIKVSEVYRDFNFSVTNNCVPLNTGLNTAPTVIPPFIDPNTGLQTAFTDTVNPGDTVSCQIIAFEVEAFTNGNMQSVILTGSGVQFGDNFTNAQMGCPNPPCATLSQSLPYVSLSSVVVNFNWVTDCGHINNSTGSCASIQNVFPFRFTARDNYCPGNGRNSFLITVVIRGAKFTINPGQTVLCLTDPPVTLTAIPPGGTFWGAISNGNQFDPASAGPGIHMVYYTVTDSSGCTTTDALAMQVNACTGWQEHAGEKGLTVYPVPASQQVHVTLSEKANIQRLELYDTSGKMVYALEVEGLRDVEIPLTGMSPGIYHLRAFGAGAITGRRIMVGEEGR